MKPASYFIIPVDQPKLADKSLPLLRYNEQAHKRQHCSIRLQRVRAQQLDVQLIQQLLLLLRDESR
jgi:hypothetical protein